MNDYRRDILVEIVTNILRAGGFAIGQPRQEESIRKWAVLVVKALEETDNKYLEVLINDR